MAAPIADTTGDKWPRYTFEDYNDASTGSAPVTLGLSVLPDYHYDKNLREVETMSLYRTFLRLIFLRYIFQGMMRLLTPLAGAWHWLTAFWRHLSHFYRHFVSNLLVGTLIAALLIACHSCRWVTELEDWAMDNMMRLNQSLPRMNPSEASRFTPHAISWRILSVSPRKPSR